MFGKGEGGARHPRQAVSRLWIRCVKVWTLFVQRCTGRGKQADGVFLVREQLCAGRSVLTEPVWTSVPQRRTFLFLRNPCPLHQQLFPCAGHSPQMVFMSRTGVLTWPPSSRTEDSPLWSGFRTLHGPVDCDYRSNSCYGNFWFRDT